jgi:hypothetical protein
MKIFQPFGGFLLSMLVALWPCHLTAAFSDLRETINFNREWKFQPGDHINAEAVVFDDAKWDSVGLPHSFSMPYFASSCDFSWGIGFIRIRLSMSFKPSKSQLGQTVLMD